VSSPDWCAPMAVSPEAAGYWYSVRSKSRRDKGPYRPITARVFLYIFATVFFSVRLTTAVRFTGTPATNLPSWRSASRTRIFA
jgi:hypothetical protein